MACDVLGVVYKNMIRSIRDERGHVRPVNQQRLDHDRGHYERLRNANLLAILGMCVAHCIRNYDTLARVVVYPSAKTIGSV